ncbi:ubiquitin carboxyl-terminal hydrolase 19-like isoform X1 [Biomphalaria glabrata]|uniref:ubiquitinyl hydrolase 1 n=1 Tax=Biomphalaria glabrata TaxID=6526 RepID=A0A9W3AA12_BIOGL|nr:ubiquitin carboxyl-terminal hydrolase 19-like isoform X1 [Biomphalaria glabrata]
MPMADRDISERIKITKLFVSNNSNNTPETVADSLEQDDSANFTKEDPNLNNEVEDLDKLSSPVFVKKSKTMQLKADENVPSYSWEQDMSSVTVTLPLNPETYKTQDLDVSFTIKEANIRISDDKVKIIHFYDAIQKDRSRVQLKRDAIKLLVVKLHPAVWPYLEAQDDEQEDLSLGSCTKTMEVDDCLDYDDVGLAGKEDVKSKMKEMLEVELVEKEEEPVYVLEQIKHDFIERGDTFTVCVYVKELDKDAVKVLFIPQGFRLNFQSGDPKFLQQHKDTTKDTVFTWRVKTRKDIEPDKCSFVVRPNKVEIKIVKKTSSTWSSLEDPVKAEVKDSSRSDTWMPLTKSNCSSSSKTVKDNAINLEKIKNSKVMFDDMADIEVNDDNQDRRAMPIPGYSNSQLDDDNDDPSPISQFGDNLKMRNQPDWNKPTAKVHPMNSSVLESGMIVAPGYAGLVNLGNTCFMNCVLQVLANTREFRDYFLENRFIDEINEDNPLGMRGQLADTFGHLLHSLWSCKKMCLEPRRLKDLIAKKNHQFFGFAQHDAHEFLAFLLDGLHEDLNRIKKKPYTPTIDSDSRPDEIVAAEAWSQYKQRNDSVVVDLFQGQYKSKLVCPKCGKVSITFDPFLYLSVPLPKKMKVIPVTFMWKEYYKKPVRFQIQVGQDSTVEKLKEELYARTHVLPSHIRVFETYAGRIHKVFGHGSSLANVEAKDLIIACEVLSEEVAGEPVKEIFVMQRTLYPSEYPSNCAFCHKTVVDTNPLKRCTKCYRVGYCDQLCQRNHWNAHKPTCSNSPEPIGCPFLLSIPASRATYSYLVKHMEGFSRYSVDIFQPPVKSEGKLPSSTLPVTNLNTSLSQSSSSLNSLDSLSSASSTCTLTGDQSDPQTQLESGGEESELIDNQDSGRYSTSDKGYESSSSKSLEKIVPMSHVMGVQAAEVDREKATPTFFIKPVNKDGIGIKVADRFEDKGDQPLDLSNCEILSMDWRNSEKFNSYVLVRSKELEAEEVDNLNNMAASNWNKPSLHQCLELFTEPEVLSPEEAWYCPSCKKHVEATKQMAVWRLPHTLIIQLKRFSFQNFLLRSKIKKHIDFPTRGLDMSPFCQGLKASDQRPIYDLYGVANHHGLLIGGHYTSYVRLASDGTPGSSEIGWRLCDDSCVTPIANEKSVVTADAYLLFYRRRGCQAVIGIPPSLSSASSRRFMDTALGAAPAPYAIPDDERNGNIVFPTQNSTRLKESINNKLLWDLNNGEASGRASFEAMNIENMSRAQAASSTDPLSIMTHYTSSSSLSPKLLQGPVYKDVSEKSDPEKDYFDCDNREINILNDYDFVDADDNDREDRSFAMDSMADLGYTDMEAVD